MIVAQRALFKKRTATIFWTDIEHGKIIATGNYLTELVAFGLHGDFIIYEKQDDGDCTMRMACLDYQIDKNITRLRKLKIRKSMFRVTISM